MSHIVQKNKSKKNEFEKGGEFQNGEILGNHTYLNSVAYDDLDSRDYIHNDFHDSSRKVEDSNKTVEHSEKKENEDKATLKIHRKYSERKMSSDLSVKAMMQKNRNQGLGNIRAIIENSLKEKDIDEADIQNLLMNRKFSLAFFGLFDVRGLGCLVQSTWFGQLRYWAKVIY